jgi:hypothetical protein
MPKKLVRLHDDVKKKFIQSKIFKKDTLKQPTHPALLEISLNEHDFMKNYK